MLATMPLFCYVDWPRKLLSKMPVFIKKHLATDDVTFQHSEHCIYPEEEKKAEAAAAGDNPAVEDIVNKVNKYLFFNRVSKQK